jgi:hypothetical protein
MMLRRNEGIASLPLALSFVATLLALTAGCTRGPAAASATAGTDPDGAVSTVSDGGLPDGGLADNTPRTRVCPADPPMDGGLAWDAGIRATLVPRQTTGWTAVSSDPSCQDLLPAPPPSQLSWAGPADAYCDSQSVNGDGDLAIYSISGTLDGFTFASGDGDAGQYVATGKLERQVVAVPRAHGFATVSFAFSTACDYSRLVDRTGQPGPAALIDGPYASSIYQVVPNPRGGFVEERSFEGGSSVAPNYLELRWVDDDLQPTGDWHTAVTWPLGTQNLWTLVVDQLGRALVLAFVFPPTLGSPPDPSAWDFSARWMGRDGPISDPFMPVVPTYTSPDGRVFFADWDIIRPLREGGFAMYHPPLQGPGTLSHSGWYAYYPTALAEVAQPPSWLSPYDGSLQLVAGGAAYAAIQRDAQTCARTVSLISPSGVTCHQLPVEGSDLCGTGDLLQADGTLIVRSVCRLRWWPQLARLMP